MGYGWSGNMERIMNSQAYAKAKDPSANFYAGQKKILEMNIYHPLVIELNKKITADPEDETATLRSGYTIKDSLDFASRIERMLRLSMGVDPDAKVELPEEPEPTEEEATEDVKAEEDEDDTKTPEDAKTATPVEASEPGTEDQVEGETTKEAPAEAKEEL